jgi:hypothetical protein
MRRIILAGLVAMGVSALAPTSVLAGPHEKNCGEIIEAGGHAPGKSEEAKGSAFNPAGTAGERYNAEKSQYDVACYQVSK